MWTHCKNKSWRQPGVCRAGPFSAGRNRLCVAPRLKSSEQQLAAAQAQTELAQVRLNYTEVHAPTNGMVNVRAALQGEVVNPGQAIVTLINPDDFWVRADIEETYIDLITNGATLNVRLPSGQERPGTVFYRGRDADYATQRDVSRSKRDIKTFELRLRCDTHDRVLATGMTTLRDRASWPSDEAMPAVEVEHIVKRFGEFVAVNDITFSVGEGEIFGLLGPNGRQIDALIRMLTTLVPPTARSWRASMDLTWRAKPVTFASAIGVIPQAMTSESSNLSAEENLTDFCQALRHSARATRSASRLLRTPRSGGFDAMGGQTCQTIFWRHEEAAGNRARPGATSEDFLFRMSQQRASTRCRVWPFGRCSAASNAKGLVDHSRHDSLHG